MKYIYSLLFVLCVGTGYCQSSVNLSGVNATVIIDPSVRAANQMMIEFSATDPLALNRIELILQDGNVNVSTLYYPVTIQNNVAQLSLDKYKAKFEGRKVRFVIAVRDQFTAPFTAVRIKGYDASNQETNVLTFNMQR